MRTLVLVFVLACGLAVAGCGSEEGGEQAAQPTGDGEAQTVEITETEFALDPANVTVDGPGTYTFRAVNAGGIVHALEVDSQVSDLEEETEDIQPGETAELTVELTEPGEYELYCPIGNHREQGMEGTLTVGGAAGGGTTTDGTTTDDETTTDDDDGYGYG